MMTAVIIILSLCAAIAWSARARRGRTKPAPVQRSAVERERARRILDLIQRRGRAMGFDELCGELAGYTREAVASGLVCLVEDEALIEELDVETGRWSYSVPVSLELGASSEALWTVHERIARQHHDEERARR